MSNSSSSSSSSKTKKEAQSALDRFKMEVASEIGVNLKEGYNGDLTSAEAGSVGGNMVKKMIRKQEEQMSSGNQLLPVICLQLIVNYEGKQTDVRAVCFLFYISLINFL